jgi:formate dehydrogenase
VETTTPTFCRICEAVCGVVATVEDGRVVDVRADRQNPHSQGFMCTKPKAMIEILNDPDRVTTPLKRIGGPGEFEPVSWDEALEDIAQRLKTIVGAHGPTAFATHVGNPSAFDACGSMAVTGLREAIGSPWHYGVNGEDGASYVAAAGLQLGSTAIFLRPDIWRTDFLLMVGANPWISKGSVISEPQIRKAMNGVIERGGRVVVVDPRRTETARHFEHVAVRPGTDAWLFLGMLRVIFDQALSDQAFLDENVQGAERLRQLVERTDLERCADRSGVPVETITDLARGFATAGSAAAYGRTGACTQRFGTLNNLLINSLNIVTGNLNRRGGAMFGWGALDFPKLAKQSGIDGYGTVRTRVLDLPSGLGMLPTQGLWRDITEPGEGQIRALLTFSANPVLSSGAGGQRLAEAYEQLDLHFSLDLYVNESNKYAHYILPGTTFYERPDLPSLGLALEIRPTLYASEQVVEPRGDAREEWRVLNEIAKRMGLGGAYPMKPLRLMAKLGINVHPMKLLDMAIRTGPAGDLFGLRRKGWSLKKLRRRAPHGAKLAEHLPVQKLGKVIQTKDKRVHLVPDEFAAEVDRLIAHDDDAAFPLRAIGQRELRSHNSWMHNAPRLSSDDRQPSALVNPSDAAEAGVKSDGEELVIESASGSITIPVTITDDIRPGAVAIPHGWGHDGGWQLANRIGGVSSNLLASAEVDDIEPLAGMSVLSGIPIRIRAAAAREDEGAGRRLAAQPVG